MSAAQQWLKEQARSQTRTLNLAVLLGVAGTLLLLAQAYLLASVVTQAAIHGRSLTELIPYLIALPPLFLLRAGAAWWAESIAVSAAATLKSELRQALYAKLQRLGPARLGELASGELVTLLSEGVESLENYFARYLPQKRLVSLIPLILLIAILPLDLISALVLLITAPLIPLFMILIGRGSERLNQRQFTRLARMGAHFLEALRGLTTLKLFGMSRRELELIRRTSDEYRRSTMAVLRVAFLSSLVLELIASLSIAMIAVLIGFRLLFGELELLWFTLGSLPFQAGLFILLLAPEFYQPLRGMGGFYHDRMAASAAAEQMIALLEREEPIRPTHPVTIPQRSFSAPAHAEAMPRPIEIELAGVTYRYPGREQGLHAIDLSIAPGEHLALIGPSGAGKSTLARLLLGFLQPQQGSIRVNGVDLNQVDPAEWWRLIGWLPQEPRLFHGTLLENITLAAPEAGSAAIEAACAQAHAKEFIDRLPQGYQTRVGEGGVGLSGGQIQRIALARTLLKNASLVLLDEPTAALDAESEAAVTAALSQLAEQRTVITIAHRPNTVRQARRIVMLEEGRCVAQGGHEELMADPQYRQLMGLQTR